MTDISPQEHVIAMLNSLVRTWNDKPHLRPRNADRTALAGELVRDLLPADVRAAYDRVVAG